MSDRELLEMAAKAAGLGEVWYLDGSDTPYVGKKYQLGQPVEYSTFSPLTDDGDSARLEATMCFHVEWHPAIKTVRVGTATIGFTTSWGDDKQAARRLAGVLCAAEIGKAMP